MASEEDFTGCIDLLAEVVRAFLSVYRATSLPEESYEADRSAFLLMATIVRHVRAIEAIAMIPKVGSHLISAWPLLRSTFETSLTAHWLTVDSDWKEREARWLGWMAGEEDYLRKVAVDIGKFKKGSGDKFLRMADRMNQARSQFMAELPKDSRYKRPNIPSMLLEAGIDDRIYYLYRIASQLTHGGPASITDLFELGVRNGKHGFFPRDVSYEDWAIPFQLAGDCIATTGEVVLIRSGANPEDLVPLYEARDRLIAATKTL